MPTFYDLDLRRASLKEFGFGTPSYLMPIIALAKLLGAPIAGSTDDPPVDAIAPFEIAEADVPEDVRAKFEPFAQELSAFGFHSPIYHAISDTLHSAKYYWASFLHPSGQAWARIHHRIWTPMGKEKVHLFPIFFTAFEDGSFLATSAGKPDMLTPDSVRMVYDTGATPKALWERHIQGTDQERTRRTVYLADHNQLRAVIDQHHTILRDYNLERGVFKPLGGREQLYLAAAEPSASQEAPITPEEAAVMVQLDRIQNKQASWQNALMVLIVSLLLFVGASRAGVGWDWKLIALIIGVVLFHELGHYLAMRWFGYRNLKMFFIPFFGAAVTGRHYNVAGWKKAVVALMGPVPGILVGAGLGFAGLAFNNQQLSIVGVFTIVLNAFNLIPFLPFDGGWVVHAVLCVRHPVLDVMFRFLAALALFGISLLLGGDKVFIGLSIVMLISLPTSWRIAKIAHDLRKEGIIVNSPDSQSIPFEAVQVILPYVEKAIPKQKQPKLRAQYIAQIFETMNARPPGIWASLALLFVQFGSFFGSIILIALMVLNPFHFLAHDVDLSKNQPAHVYVQGHTQFVAKANDPEKSAHSQATIIASFASDAEAAEAFTKFAPEAPPRGRLTQFGAYLFLTLPVEAKDAQSSWKERLGQQAKEVMVDEPNKSRIWVRFYFEAPSEEEARKLEERLAVDFHATEVENLIPIWSPIWQAANAKDQERFQKARLTLFRLDELQAKVYAHPDIKKMQEPDLMAIFSRRNPEEVRKRANARNQIIKIEKARLLAALKAEGGETLDRAVVSIWEELDKLYEENIRFFNADELGKDKPDPAEKVNVRFEDWDKKRKALLTPMSARMGQVEFKDGKPKPGSLTYSVAMGGLQRQKQLLASQYLTFHNPSQGLPALAEWLCKQGCQVRYEIKTSPADLNDPDSDNDEREQPKE